MNILLFLAILLNSAQINADEYQLFNTQNLAEAIPIVETVEEVIEEVDFVEEEPIIEPDVDVSSEILAKLEGLIQQTEHLQERVDSLQNEIIQLQEIKVEPAPEPEHIHEPEPIPIEDIIVIDEQAEINETLQYWYNVYFYLFGTAGLTLTGILGRVGYLFYKTQTGQLIIKHIKTKVYDIEEDIIDSANKIADLNRDNVEAGRDRLRQIEEYIRELAKQKFPLPPAPPEPPKPKVVVELPEIEFDDSLIEYPQINLKPLDPFQKLEQDLRRIKKC